MEEAAHFSRNAVARDAHEAGVAEVSSNLYENVTRYHAQIGHNVNKDELQQLEWNLLGEAKTLFHQRKFEEALNTFTHCLAVTEKTRSAKDHAVRGAVIHNIASCLHNLGEMEAAQAYYEQAIEAFKKAKVPLLERVIYGDANKRRMDFVKERLVDITWGRKPDCDKYLDENGQKRPVPAGLTPPEDYPRDDEEPRLSEGWRRGEPRLPGWASADGDGYGPDGGGGRGHGEASYGQVAVAGYDADDREGGYTISQSYSARSSGAASQQPSTVGQAPPDDEQEAARKEWLQYHMEMGEWEQAAELVVTQEEQEDLEYLIQRQRRMGGSSSSCCNGSGQAAPSHSNPGRTSGGAQAANDVTSAAAGAHGTGGAAPNGPPVGDLLSVDDEDQML